MYKHGYITPPLISRRRKNRVKTLLRYIKYSIYTFFGFVVVMTFLFLITIHLDIAFTSKQLQLRNIIIEGNKTITQSELLKVAGITNETNYFSADKELIRQRILQIPSISQCEVEKVYPDKLIIRIQEYIPYATLFVNDSFYLIDHNCIVLNQVYSLKDCVGPLITGLKVAQNLKPGDYIDNEGLWSALKFWYQLNQVSLNKVTVSEIVIDSGGTLKVFFNEIPCETRWKNEQIQRQIQNFCIAMKKIDLTQLPCMEYIDFRFNDDIICK